MVSRDVDRFLTKGEQSLLRSDRDLTLARTRETQADILLFYGATDDDVRANLANMGATFDNFSSERIKRIQHAISEYALVLTEVQPLTEVPKQLEDLLNGLLPEEEIEKIIGFNGVQKDALVRLMSDIYERSSAKPENGPKHMQRLSMFLDGYDVKAIAAEQGVLPDVINGAFRTSLPKIYLRNKEEFVSGFTEILDMTADSTLEQLDGSTAAMEDAFQEKIDTVRTGLGALLPDAEPELLDRIIQRIQGEPVEYDAVLIESLLVLFRKGKNIENDLPQENMIILKAFGGPLGRNGQTMSVAEIKKMLAEKNPEHRSRYENGFVTDNLLDTLTAMINAETARISIGAR